MNSIPSEILAAAELISERATRNSVEWFAMHGIQSRMPGSESGVQMKQLIAASPIESGLPPDFDTKSS